ncbi:type 1 periplasmic-binding domain-containing protein [Pseudothermotoga thermarum]|uniref:Leucine-binding protein domain-containing protein n=1 Tax=Pseudothermotoga thermarum DSM 5069 TaxID=688269 RepID=F7YX29_9THEM|nr:hypothetical protein [Pseudothermotoga thermarum]AEH50732.1 hypothetical protein Theth_0645 [Pseudothermotoga thermarum DSM 5069]
MKQSFLIIVFTIVSILIIYIAYLERTTLKILIFEDGIIQLQQGLDRYVKETGFKCKPIVIRIDRSLEEIEKFLRDNQKTYAIGPRTSSQALRLIPLLEKYQIFAIAPLVTSPEVLGKSNYLVSLSSSDDLQVRHIASLLLDFENIVVFTDFDNPVYCDTFYDILVKELPEKTILKVVVDKVENLSLPDEFDVVVFVTEGRKAGLIAQMIRSRNFEIPLFGSDYVYSDQLIQIGGKAVEGMIVYNLFDLERMLVRNFTSLHEAGSYDAALVIDSLVKQGVKPNLAGEYLKGKSFSGATGDFTISENLWAVRKSNFVTVQNGSFVPLKR